MDAAVRVQKQRTLSWGGDIRFSALAALTWNEVFFTSFLFFFWQTKSPELFNSDDKKQLSGQGAFQVVSGAKEWAAESWIGDTAQVVRERP